MTYNVKEASKKIQMSVHNIRYYTNLELVPSLKHDKHGNRVFDDESLNWLICIRFLRESGMSLSDIKHYFELSKRELEMIQKRTKCIQSKVIQCKRALSGEIPDDCNPINWD